ncbi:hypothetical protein ACE04B_36245, partial [Rhizobium phaseoli]
VLITLHEGQRLGEKTCLDFAFGLVHGNPAGIDRGLLSQVSDRGNNPERNSFSYVAQRPGNSARPSRASTI